MKKKEKSLVSDGTKKKKEMRQLELDVPCLDKMLRIHSAYKHVRSASST